uniref:histone acetyltransferase n=1 Tax=Peronospora matthiolae TaxID=2874970 RepID=A0AAV1T9Y2_9STRA
MGSNDTRSFTAEPTAPPHGVKRAPHDVEPLASPCNKKLKCKDQDDAATQAETPAVAPSRRRSAALSPLNVASAAQIRQHLSDVRRELFLRPLVATVSKLMFHKRNHGFFNVRVDPLVWNIPHYFEVVKQPMDLTLVKNKCMNLEYASADECAADVRLVFTNACLFNPPGHVVHEAAVVLLKEFETDFAKYQVKVDSLATRRNDHSCLYCLDNVCSICKEKCVTFEPPFVVCSGACRQRIKRNAVYYKSSDGHYHWCTKCYASLPKMLVLKTASSMTMKLKQESTVMAEYAISKLELLKAKFMDELTEPWVQCDYCNGWVHQICALFNACENGDENEEEVLYMCPLCRLQELDALEKNAGSIMSPIVTSVEDFPVKLEHGFLQLHSPALKCRRYDSHFTRALEFGGESDGKAFGTLPRPELDAENASTSAGYMRSQSLRSCNLSRFMQKWVRHHLNALGEHGAAKSIVVKVVSSIEVSCHVSAAVRENFRSAFQEYPETIGYTSKVIFVFQMISGIEVCIFSMYVQEYDKHCELPSNRNRTYIAYLDSLVYVRPRHVRTSLFHQTLISYLAFCKSRRFDYAHIWACPTTRGGDFIYWCHPSFQKNPGKERLLQWYLTMSRKAMELGVVFACDDLYSREFEKLDDTLDTQLPPYFDGDFWPSEAERIAASPRKRGKKEPDVAGVCSEKFRKRVGELVKAARESLFVIVLQPTCAACNQLIVNTTYWRAGAIETRDIYYCAKCRVAAATAVDAAGQVMSLTEVTPPDFEEACSNDETEKAEISCQFLDRRPDMLKNCEERHYQFDSFRRAKYSTMMLVYQISSSQRVAQ